MPGRQSLAKHHLRVLVSESGVPLNDKAQTCDALHAVRYRFTGEYRVDTSQQAGLGIAI
jgi:hypothetical protein